MYRGLWPGVWSPTPSPLGRSLPLAHLQGLPEVGVSRARDPGRTPGSRRKFGFPARGRDSGVTRSCVRSIRKPLPLPERRKNRRSVDQPARVAGVLSPKQVSWFGARIATAVVHPRSRRNSLLLLPCTVAVPVFCGRRGCSRSTDLRSLSRNPVVSAAARTYCC